MIIYCNSREHTLEIEGGKPVTLEQVKQYVAEGEITDCNLALQRLEQMDWDWDKLDQFYANAN